MMVLIAAILFLLNGCNPEEEPGPVTVPSAEPTLTEQSTEYIVDRITQQASARAGRSITIDCPPTAPIVKDHQFVCEAYDGDELIKDVLVTITNPGARGAFVWTSLDPGTATPSTPSDDEE